MTKDEIWALKESLADLHTKIQEALEALYDSTVKQEKSTT